MASIFRPDLFAHKHVRITGGSSDVNLQIAHAFGEHGASVAIYGRKVEKLDAAVASLRAKGMRAEGYAADVRDYAAVEASCRAFGPIDVFPLHVRLHQVRNLGLSGRHGGAGLAFA